MGAVGALRTEHQIAERKVEQGLDLGERPVVARDGVHMGQ